MPIDGDVALDRQAVHVLERLVAGDVERAAVLARSLARNHPRFTLGQLLHAELSAAAASDRTLVGSRAAWSPALVDLLLEARARLDAGTTNPRGRSETAPSPPRDTAPSVSLVQIGRDVDHLVLVDLERATLALHAVRDGVATRVREHYVSSGSAGFGKRREGDRKTPLGLYRIVDTHDDRELPELYGAGALVLDYPNAHDRHLGRTGSGIWLHGVPRAGRSRAPRSSEGCVTMSNEHLRALDERLDPARTLVVLASAAIGAGVEHGDRGTVAGHLTSGDREGHRALFRRWRDARVLDPSAPIGLARVDENDVTIVETTADGLPGVADLLVVALPPLAVDAAGITLWWTRPGADDDWTLELEDSGPGGT